MEQILCYIREHFSQDISLTEIADRYDLTPNHLGTQLKLRLGMRFTDYLTELRIARAKELLADSSLPIKEITLQVGYYSQSYFTRIFSQKTGSTPAEFRQNNSPISH
ncbi:MAG: AraC family transcriptional regulator [Clostridiales bacterium]|nr:AraC family transcriptional regulator [Clostridiales bacterium]